MTKSKGSSSFNKSKKREKESLEEEKSNQLCGACGQPLYGERIESANASIRSVSNHEIKEEQKMSKASIEDAKILSSSDSTAVSGSSIDPVVRKNTIITCSNMSGPLKWCRSFQSDGFSPHFHLSCLEKMIPQRSKMYRDICQYVHEVEEDTKRKKMRCEMSYPVRSQQKESSNHVNTLEMDIMSQHDERKIKLPDKVPLDKIGRHNSVIGSCIESGSNTFVGKKSLPTNPFLCELCDIQGSSQYLSEYFANFRMMKKEFYGDDEAVDAIHPISLLTPNDNEMMQEETGFVKHLMEKDQELNPQVSYKPTEVTTARIRHILQHTARNQNEIRSSSVIDNDTITPFSLIGQPIRLFCNVTNSYHTGRIIDARDSKSIDASRLKSSTIQKYMRQKSSWKSSSRMKQTQSCSSHVKFDRDIASTQYLVRFRSRIEGRKSTVHQWLYLEEHPCMVGVNIVWANLHQDDLNANKTSQVKDGDLSSDAEIAESEIMQLRRLKKSKARFYPGQIFLRTALEMMHIDDISPNIDAFSPSKDHASCEKRLKKDRNGLNVTALIFYDTYKCVRLSLDNRVGLNTCNTRGNKASNCAASKSSCKSKQGDLSDISYTLSVLGQPFHNISVADFRYPPPDLKEYLEVLKAYDESLVHAIVCACCEEEEQRRLRQWHTKHACVSFEER
jgi:hypothetical protein